jgi:hypothetical protein
LLAGWEGEALAAKKILGKGKGNCSWRTCALLWVVLAGGGLALEREELAAKKIVGKG